MAISDHQADSPLLCGLMSYLVISQVKRAWSYMMLNVLPETKCQQHTQNSNTSCQMFYMAAFTRIQKDCQYIMTLPIRIQMSQHRAVSPGFHNVVGLYSLTCRHYSPNCNSCCISLFLPRLPKSPSPFV